MRDFTPTRDLAVEMTIAEADAGYDFTTAESVAGRGFVLPRSFVITGGGTLSFVDDDDRTRVVHAAAQRSYPATIRQVTGATGAGYVQFFASEGPGWPRVPFQREVDFSFASSTAEQIIAEVLGAEYVGGPVGITIDVRSLTKNNTRLSVYVRHDVDWIKLDGGVTFAATAEAVTYPVPLVMGCDFRVVLQSNVVEGAVRAIKTHILAGT